MSMIGISVASQHSLNFETAVSANDKYVAYLTNLIIDKKYSKRKELIMDEAQKLLRESDEISDLSNVELENYPNLKKLEYENFVKELERLELRNE